MFNRRQLLALTPGGLFIPRKLWAAPKVGERKFLFIYAYGGWDTTMVYTPAMDLVNVDSEAEATKAEANGLTFVDHPSRPAVRQFFEDWGDRAAIINGVQVRSVTHERCQRIMFTGSGEAGGEDWPVAIAAAATEAYAMPHLVIAGPAFTSANAAKVVRAGETGQLAYLLDGTALEASDLPVVAPNASASELEEAFLKARIEKYRSTATIGRQTRFGGLYTDALDNLGLLRELASDIDLDPSVEGGCSRDIAKDAATAFNAFEKNLARCSLTRDDGWCAIGWDTHTSNSYQAVHYEQLFGFLSEIMEDLEGRTTDSGSALKDEVTICVFSEMGRHPKINASAGRDHWTYTSVLLVGAGVRGGTVVGALNEDFAGMPVNLDTGEPAEDGADLLPGHVGATLMALADVDYEAYLTQGEAPILAAIDP